MTGKEREREGGDGGENGTGEKTKGNRNCEWGKGQRERGLWQRGKWEGVVVVREAQYCTEALIGTSTMHPARE